MKNYLVSLAVGVGALVTVLCLSVGDVPEADALVPLDVAADMGHYVAADGTNWVRVGTFNGTEFASRLTAAHGYVDAGFSDTTGTVFTIDLPLKIGGAFIETEDVLVRVSSLFTFGAPDAGASTTVLDVGVSGTLEKFAKDVDMLTAANTLGSATTSVKPRNFDAAPLKYRLTFTQSAKNLTTVTGGQVSVYVKAGAVRL